MKRLFKGIGITMLVLGLIVIVYLAYVFLSYHRIEDHQILQVTGCDQNAAKTMAVGETYSIISCNIGFGAYSDDYSFFMDGGKYSRAFSKEAVLNNTDGSIELVKQYEPDFVLFQEVDTDSDRNYHVNQCEIITDAFPEMEYNYAVDYDSPYLFYPFLEPHGASKSGLATLAKFPMTSALRRSLPISTGLAKMVDLDRCYVITRIPTENGRELVLFHVHLSAYTDDIRIVQNQIQMLAEDMEKEYRAGNYIVCGGDFNQDMLGNSPEIYGTGNLDMNWCNPFPAEYLPEGISRATDALTEEERAALPPSCRVADSPYVAGKSFVTMVDGFLVSDNVEVVSFNTIDNSFQYSDHNPVRMEFCLK